MRATRIAAILTSLCWASACNAILDIKVFPAGPVSDAASDDALTPNTNDARGDEYTDSESHAVGVSDALDVLTSDGTAVAVEADSEPGTLADAIVESSTAVEAQSVPDGPDEHATDVAIEATYDATGPDADASVEASSNPCGSGIPGPGKQCDLGSGNSPTAYGKYQCTDKCQWAPYCGDGIVNGFEVCDGGDAGSNALGACNPECTGYYAKKVIRETAGFYSTNLGGPAGADGICQSEFGVGWKALLVGGNRRATVTPFVGDQPSDWVLKKYMYYYNVHDQLVWITDNVALIGIRSGARTALNAPAFDASGSYPWAGWASDWTTIPDDATNFGGTCAGWTSVDSNSWGDFAFADLTLGASETCGGSSFILCVQQ